ncbi:hypothetical protein C8R46DRAFT_1298188 [Mycena filopes]|nr:hypothetical protein C8R46DRAFT_1298188 [Mycena filopes]
MALVVSPIVSVLISIWLETLVYGLNIAAFSLSLYVTLRKASVNRVVLGLLTALFACATGHIGINLCRLVEGYIQPPTKEGMIAFLLNITVKTNVAKQYMLVMVNLFSDMLLVWRVYMVWDKNLKITAIPAVLCAGAFLTGIATAIDESIVKPGQPIFFKKIASWATSQFSLSLAMNVTTTILIASRIWYATRVVREVTPTHMAPYWRVIVIIIESASIAAVAQIIQLAFYETKFPGIYFISDTVVQIVTMAPLIIIGLVGVSGNNRDGVLGTSYAVSELRFGDKIPVGLGDRQTHGTDNFDSSEGMSTSGGDVHEIRTVTEKRPSREVV